MREAQGLKALQRYWKSLFEAALIVGVIRGVRQKARGQGSRKPKPFPSPRGAEDVWAARRQILELRKARRRLKARGAR